MEKLLVEEEKVILKGALLKRKRVDAEGLLNLIERDFGVSKEEIKGGGQKQVITKARSFFCYLSSRQLEWTGKQLYRRHCTLLLLRAITLPCERKRF